MGAETAGRLGLKTEADLYRLLDEVRAGRRKAKGRSGLLPTRTSISLPSSSAGPERPSVRLSGIFSYEQGHRTLECVPAAEADFLVTEDKQHLQPLKTFRGIPIVSPREFLDLLRSSCIAGSSSLLGGEISVPDLNCLLGVGA